MAWPTGADVQQRTDIALTQTGEDGDYKTSYGLNVTSMITDAIASAALECLRDPENGFDEATVTETHDGRGVLQVGHPPIISVTSLTSDGDDVDEDDYIAYTRHIKILDDGTRTRLQSYAPDRPDRSLYSLVYVGGYSDSETGTHQAIPRALSSIILEMVVRQLMKIDQKYRVYSNISKLDIGSATYNFQSNSSLFSDLYRQLRAGPWVVIGI